MTPINDFHLSSDWMTLSRLSAKSSHTRVQQQTLKTRARAQQLAMKTTAHAQQLTGKMTFTLLQIGWHCPSHLLKVPTPDRSKTIRHFWNVTLFPSPYDDNITVIVSYVNDTSAFFRDFHFQLFAGSCFVPGLLLKMAPKMYKLYNSAYWANDDICCAFDNSVSCCARTFVFPVSCWAPAFVFKVL